MRKFKVISTNMDETKVEDLTVTKEEVETLMVEEELSEDEAYTEFVGGKYQEYNDNGFAVLIVPAEHVNITQR